MGRRLMAAPTAMARCSPSTPTGRVLRNCIVSPAGAHPIGGLILSGNTLFGTASGGYNSGGDFLGNGTVFSITLPSPPQLRIIRSAGNVILSWPTNAAGLTFTLQSTRNLVSPAGWTTVSPASVVFNGQNAVTNPISGT